MRVLFVVSVRRATIFPLVSLLILLVGEIIFFIGYCNQRSVLTFLAGILFVVGGKVATNLLELEVNSPCSWGEFSCNWS